MCTCLAFAQLPCDLLLEFLITFRLSPVETQTNTPSLQNPFFLKSQTMSSSFTGKFFFLSWEILTLIMRRLGTSPFPSKSSASLLLNHDMEIIYESKVEILSSSGGYLSGTHGRGTLVRPPTPPFKGIASPLSLSSQSWGQLWFYV